tara:strand:- start:23 stop:766 length:744 start_codon:yes stop_codon:yes gene_type:complete
MEKKKYTIKEQRDFRQHGLKGCQSCGQVKSLDDFYFLSKRNTRKPNCIECSRTTHRNFYPKEYKELKKEGKKGCQSCNEVKPLDKMRKMGQRNGKVKYGSVCKVCFNKQQKKDYWDNRQSELERCRIKNKKYWDKNKNTPEFIWSQKIMRHLKGVSNRQKFKDLWDEVYQVYDMYNIPYHIDHMVPKSWFLVRTPKSLINHIDNLQVIDAKYNSSKKHFWSDPVPNEYLDKIRPYVKKKFEGLLKSL